MIYYFKRISFFIFLISVVALTTLTAQINNFKKWTIREGLAQSDVYSIAQDHQGYLWVGTGAGFSMFDGKTFKNFSEKDGLCGNTVRAIYEDKKQRVWLATENGVSVYDGKIFQKINKEQGFSGQSGTCIVELGGKIYIGTDDGGINVISDLPNGNYKVEHINKDNGLMNATIMSMHVDLKGNIWAANYGGGINIITFKNGKPQVNSIKGLSKIPSNNLFAINEDAHGTMYVSSEDKGVFTFKADEFLKGNYTYQLVVDQSGISPQSVWHISVSKTNEIWMGSLGNGVYRLNQNQTITQYTDKEGLNGNQILAIFQDKNGSTWFGTQGEGLALLQGDYFSHYTTNNGLSDNKVRSIVKDQNQTYWLATSEGGLVSMVLNNNVPVFKTYGTSDGLVSENISSLATGNKHNANLWIGTNANGIIKFDRKIVANYTANDGLGHNRVYCICVDQKGIVWCGTAAGISKYDGTKFLSVSTEKMLMQNEGVKSIICDDKENIWFASAGGLARYSGDGTLRTFDEEEGLKMIDVNSLAIDKSGNVWMGTNGGGIYKFDIKQDDKSAIALEISENKLSSGIIKSMLFMNDSTLIVGTFKGFDKVTFAKSGNIKAITNYNANDGFSGVECNENAIFMDEQQQIWFGTVNGLTKYSPALEPHIATAPVLKITDIQLFFKPISWKERGDSITPWFNHPDRAQFNYNENHFTFKFNAVALNSPEKLMYSYYMEGKDKEWSPLKPYAEVTYSGLEPGNYVFKIKAIDASGVWSEPQIFSLEIVPPWYKTTLFYVSVILLLIVVTVTYVKWREKKLVKEKENLERIVDEKTLEIREQKEHIAEKHKEITDSINYAERIQRSFLATDEMLDLNLKEYFVFFKPKDVVSGDFYWASTIVSASGGENFILATADSTGHGVPGAIMSLLNITSLEKAIEHLTNPAEILSHTRQTIINRLKKDGSKEGGKDGMDCSVMVFDFKNKKLYMAAANNPVWIVRSHSPLEGGDRRSGDVELIEIKPDKMPVGKHDRDQEPFTQHVIDLMDGDIIYSLTDGFPDQFGGEKGKKFMSKNLRELLLANSFRPMNEQKQVLENTFSNWVGKLEQIDDVTVIGVKI